MNAFDAMHVHIVVAGDLSMSQVKANAAKQILK